MLEPDVLVYFPTSKSVNQALRKLIAEKKPAVKIAAAGKINRKSVKA